MADRQTYDDDDDVRVVRDGERIRVPLQMMDSVQRSIFDTFGPWRYDDAADPLALHQSGPRFVDAAQQEVRDKAYDEYVEGLTTAWQKPPIGSAAAAPAWPSPRSDRHTVDACEQAYAEYVARLCDAWRTGQ